jgi:hypothetical protein
MWSLRTSGTIAGTLSALLLLQAGMPAWAQLPVPSDDSKLNAKDWQVGALVDVAYGLNFNFPENHRFRSKTTTPRTNEFAPNMLLAYIRKEPLRGSRWGTELALQAGYDTNALVPEPEAGRDEPIAGADILRHVSRANLSYLAPLGNGLTLSAGLMEGYINYESFYAKDNFNYTRAYVTENSPNFMLGVGARYPISGNVDVGFHVFNSYKHLSHPNDQPSYGAEVDWRISKRTTLAQNLYFGPDQEATSLRYWRFFSDTQIEWVGEEVTIAAIYDFGTEQAVDLPGSPRTFWTGGAFFTQWNLKGPWSAAIRPEIYWDRNGRMTEFEQVIWAVTTTVEYRKHFGPQLGVVRLEYRYDDSTGKDGGFFRRGEISPGLPELVRSQHVLFFSLLWAFDS